MCRQLGYPGAVRVASFGSHSNQIWLDDVKCIGNETSIVHCSHNGFNIYDCNFNNDQVGVECIGQFVKFWQLAMYMAIFYMYMHTQLVCMFVYNLYVISMCMCV